MPRQRRAQALEALTPPRQSSRLKRKREKQAEDERERAKIEDSSRTRTKKAKTAETPARKQNKRPPRRNNTSGTGARRPATVVFDAIHEEDDSNVSSVLHASHTASDGPFDQPENHPDLAPNDTAAQSAGPELTDGFVRSLLPGAMFGLADDIFARGLWGVAHERALRSQQFTASPDFARFREAQIQMYLRPRADGEDDPLDAELRLWEVLQHRFRCGLEDLFRYGLRPSLGASGALFSQYCIKLTAILVHPLWAPTHLAHVRWIFQRIVQERVPGHIRPLVPPYSYHRPAFADVARHWGFETGMRLCLDNVGTLACDRPAANSYRDPVFVRLAAASREAAKAAAAAEAEMTWFLFSASGPREFWRLDRQLAHLYEPGREGMEDEVEEDVRDEEDEPNPFGLEVCEDIKLGCFGALEDSYDGCEITERQDLLRREDSMMHRTRSREWWEEEETVGTSGLRDDQVFFNLCIQDLDRLLRLMADPKFLAHGGFTTPECYYAGYIKAHEVYGYGEKRAETEEEKPDPPFLTCMQCAQRYHQGGGGEAEESDKEYHHAYDNRDHHHDHDHSHIHDSHDHHMHDTPDHGHFLHQHFVRDLGPGRAVEWLLHRKCEWLLSGCRERIIREALEMEHEVIGRKGAQISLPDIPPFDPAPQGHLDHVFTHPSQLAVFDRVQGNSHASVLWCLNGAGGEGAEGVDGQ